MELGWADPPGTVGVPGRSRQPEQPALAAPGTRDAGREGTGRGLCPRLPRRGEQPALPDRLRRGFLLRLRVSIPGHLHDRLDEAVAAAYGWPADLPAVEVVARIVALNAERRVEEADGLVRWLRPEFQAPEEVRRAATQPALDIEPTEAPGAIVWPRDDPARQFIVLRSALIRITAPTAPAELARGMTGAPRGGKIGEVLRVLVALGQARDAGSGRFTA
jgi:hypothetical protein